MSDNEATNTDPVTPVAVQLETTMDEEDKSIQKKKRSKN